MKNINRTFLISLMTFCFGIIYSQTTDSLSVYPNPFEHVATIHFDIVESDTITLEVFNSSGLSVKTFFQSTVLPSGSYNINLFGDGLVAGVYFVRLDIGSSKRITKSVIKVGATTSVLDNDIADQFLIFPNPTKNLITVPVLGSKKIVVTNLNGKILKSFMTDQQVVSLSGIIAGQYIITVLSNENEIITTQRILKID
ncbi:T9SS type A sorting domain-containing protein [Brumimicrobium glaciale]|uniref:T9SS type A sorting domain-containing protein n=1 Tax=Brumimicrobium glaciale TaxID=200475 RepID=A0A4V1WFN1_9FLAO|nr:T9SS type A sorting domain-containing protein [Brumimicrobium glaciale]RYM33776.1 T9SS type A sorting domain-containing protein [Brumimicrobium glaciale]